MEREQLEKIFMAIKSDDEKSFTSFMLSKSDLNLCFGRFPILSLCYLYQSVKILSKYEKYLAPINKFEVVPEYYEIYKAFKRKAKRSLRLFLDSEKIVYPILMLGVLDERNLICHKYKLLYKNEEILQKLKKIYILNQEIEINATTTNFECKAKKITRKQKIISGILSFVFCVVSALSFVSINIVKNTYGLGTAGAPISISSEQEFLLALEKGDKHYVLKNDIVISSVGSIKDFSGVIEGNDHTVYLPQNMASSVIRNLSGTIKNLNFEFGVENIVLTTNYAVLTENNTGIIENCSFFGKVNASINSTKTIVVDGTQTVADVYVSGVAVQNQGTISGVVVNISANLSNQGQTNAYVSAIVGQNHGTIQNVQTAESNFVTDTVDIAGLVAENYGTIASSVNNISMSQTSNKDWHPNCAGIVMSNYGVVDSCINNGSIYSESTKTEVVEGGELHVYAGGIVCNNYKKILNSKNYGEISGEGNVSLVFAGGIAALNVVDEKYSYEIEVQNGREIKYVVCEISKSKSTGRIYAQSEKASVYAGGVAAVNNTQITYSGFEGEIEANTNKSTENEVIVFAGGVVGINNHTPLQNCYALIEFKNKPDDVENIVKAYGAVAGFIGNSRIYNEFLGQTGYSEAYNYINSNYYVVDDSVQYSALGRLTTIHDFFGTEITYSFEKIANDEKYFIKVESIEKVPGGVRIYE